jgi:hypothetical protein
MSSSGKRRKAKKQGNITSSFKDTYEGLSDTAKQDYINYIESLTQLQELQEGMGSAQSSYDEALAEYQREEAKRTDVLDARNEQMFTDRKDQFGNVVGRQTKGFERGFGADYNPNRAMEQFNRMIEAADNRIDYGVERRGEYRYTDADYQKMLDNMKAFGTEEQYDQMVDKLKGLDRDFKDLRFAKAYGEAQAQFAPELTAAASQVQAMRDQYGESSAEAQAAYDQYLEAYKKLSGMKYGDQYGGAPKKNDPFRVATEVFGNEAFETTEGAISAPDFVDLGGNTGMGFDLMDQEQINAMSSDELTAYLDNLMEYYG